jgi:hypothetical protein
VVRNLHFLGGQKTKQKSHRRIFTSLIPYRSEAANPLTHFLRSLERNGFIDFILGIPLRRKAEAGKSGLDAEWTIIDKIGTNELTPLLKESIQTHYYSIKYWR